MWIFEKSTKDQVNPPAAAGDASKRGWSAWIWTERLMIGFGVALLLFHGAVRIDSYLQSRVDLQRFEALKSLEVTAASDATEETIASRSVPAPDPSVETDSPHIDFSLWAQHRVRAYRENLAAKSAVPVAVLRIPKINLEAPVLDGTDAVTLNHGVGRIAGTAKPGQPGNIGIAGHRDGFFRGLKDLATGDSIELATRKGTDTYVIDRIQIVTPDQVEVLRPRAVPSVTLVTCYPFYVFGSAPERYIVTASLSREIQSGAEISTPSPLSISSSSTRRNHEQSK
jgi:sortase A